MNTSNHYWHVWQQDDGTVFLTVDPNRTERAIGGGSLDAAYVIAHLHEPGRWEHPDCPDTGEGEYAEGYEG